MKKLISISLGVFIVLGIVSYFLLMPKPVYGWPSCSSEYDECMRSAWKRFDSCLDDCAGRRTRGVEGFLCDSLCATYYTMDELNCSARLACCWFLGIFRIC